MASRRWTVDWIASEIDGADNRDVFFGQLSESLRAGFVELQPFERAIIERSYPRSVRAFMLEALARAHRVAAAEDSPARSSLRGALDRALFASINSDLSLEAVSCLPCAAEETRADLLPRVKRIARFDGGASITEKLTSEVIIAADAYVANLKGKKK